MEIDEVRPWPAGAWQRLLAAVITRSDELTELAGGPPAAGGGPSAAAAERQFGVRVPRGFAKRIRPSDPATRSFARCCRWPPSTKRWTASATIRWGSSPPRAGAGSSRSTTAAPCSWSRRCAPSTAATASAATSPTATTPSAAGSGRPPSSSSPPTRRSLRSSCRAATRSRCRTTGSHGWLTTSRRSPMSGGCGSTPGCRSCSRSGWTRLSSAGCPGCACRWSWWSMPTTRTRSTPRFGGRSRSCAAAGSPCSTSRCCSPGSTTRSRRCASSSEQLFEAGALPYYLHLLDRVRGAAHFEVPEADALRLVAGVRDRMPGYLVPRLVREVAGAPSKVAVELRDEG